MLPNTEAPTVLPGLVITRGESEKIILVDTISGKVMGSIRIQDIKGKKVRLKLDFPRSIEIYREELYEARLESARSQNGPLNPQPNQ
jgi:sRNA-binding carbon storage regulator CsrA